MITQKSITITTCQSWHKSKVTFKTDFTDDNNIQIEITDEKKKDKKGAPLSLLLWVNRSDFFWMLDSLREAPHSPAADVTDQSL